MPYLEEAQRGRIEYIWKEKERKHYASHIPDMKRCGCVRKKRKRKDKWKNRAEAGEKEISEGGEGPQSRRPHSAVHLYSEKNDTRYHSELFN